MSVCSLPTVCMQLNCPGWTEPIVNHIYCSTLILISFHDEAAFAQTTHCHPKLQEWPEQTVFWNLVAFKSVSSDLVPFGMVLKLFLYLRTYFDGS